MKQTNYHYSNSVNLGTKEDLLHRSHLVIQMINLPTASAKVSAGGERSHLTTVDIGSCQLPMNVVAFNLVLLSSVAPTKVIFPRCYYFATPAMCNVLRGGVFASYT